MRLKGIRLYDGHRLAAKLSSPFIALIGPIIRLSIFMTPHLSKFARDGHLLLIPLQRDAAGQKVGDTFGKEWIGVCYFYCLSSYWRVMAMSRS